MLHGCVNIGRRDAELRDQAKKVIGIALFPSAVMQVSWGLRSLFLGLPNKA
ncbi:MAG: hypothetical protein IJE27_00820 [Anaerotignum sp.]|nr:hypothetical protein [Anaerotignum sp.]